MCGLAGFYGNLASNDQTAIATELTRMTDAIVHRGPDDAGQWVDVDDQVALGHRRLAIQDLSAAGHQPMLSAGSRYVLVFNGEIYNHLDIRAEVEAQAGPRHWRGHSDTETLLAAFEAFGWVPTLTRLVGMFAIVLWDRQDKALYMARDRFGEKPLYYGWQQGTLLFGSELKALVQHGKFEKKIEPQAVGSLLRHGYVASPHSIWQGIYKLPPGHQVRFDALARDPKPVAYWSLRDQVERANGPVLALSDQEAVDQVEARLTQAIRQQMISDVPFGALLSGGIDSSLVVALMQRISPQPVKTFCIGFEDPAFDESGHAEAVARHLGTDHTTLIMGPDDMLKLVPEIARIYDEPFADSSQLPTTLVSRLAKQQVTVALSGDAGDEVFGGYNRYFMATRVWDVLRRIPTPIKKLGIRAVFALDADTWSRHFGALAKRVGISNLGDKLYKLAQRLEGVQDFNGLYLSLVTEMSELDQVLTAGANLKPDYLLGRPADWPRVPDLIERMMALDTLTYLVDDILVKVDRAAMSTSLELRAPFLNHHLVEFAWRLPLSKKIRDHKGKWVLREVLYRHVPRAIIDRPKQGFGIPLDAWLRGPLKTWAEGLLFDPKLLAHGFFKIDGIRELWAQHQSGEKQYGARLWSILMFQAWYQENFYG